MKVQKASNVSMVERTPVVPQPGDPALRLLRWQDHESGCECCELQEAMYEVTEEGALGLGNWTTVLNMVGAKTLERMCLRRAAYKAIEVFMYHADAAAMDAGFDAGEFSGPRHQAMADNEITVLAHQYGFSYNQVMDMVAYVTNHRD
jgi:hypothetical protein